MKTIFVDVDVQRDFCNPDGSLYVSGSPTEQFVRLTQLAQKCSIPIVGSVDSHAYDAWEFASNDNRGPNGEDPGFPDHCVKGTSGWLKVDGTLPSRFRFVPNVDELETTSLVQELMEGQVQALYFEKEVYSMFANPVAEGLVMQLADAFGGLRFVVYGVATDYCVKAAALGLRERGYATVLLVDAVAGITDAGVESALAAMCDAGVEMMSSDALDSSLS